MINKFLDVGKIIVTTIVLIILSLFICVHLQIGPPAVDATPFQIQAVAKGGTGATTASGARTNLGITLSNLDDPGAVKTFTMANYTLKFDWTTADPAAITFLTYEWSALATDTDVDFFTYKANDGATTMFQLEGAPSRAKIVGDVQLNTDSSNYSSIDKYMVNATHFNDFDWGFTVDQTFDDGTGDSPGFKFTGEDNETVKVYYDDSDDRYCFIHSGGTNNEEICFALDDTANTVQVESGSGVLVIDFGALALNTSGAITGISGYTPHTSDYDIGANYTVCGGRWFATGDAAARQFTLPAATIGDVCCFADDFGGIISLDPDDGTDYIVVNGTSYGAGDELDLAAGDGNFVCIQARTADEWIARGRYGVLSDGGAT